MSDSMLCGLIGTGIGASLTPIMHEEEGRRQGLPYVYRILDLDVMGMAPSDIGELLTYARRFGFRGLNITHPCKQLVIEHLDELSPDASRLGAVNTVLFDSGKAIGHNTDWSGFGRNFDDGLPGAQLDRVVQLGAAEPVRRLPMPRSPVRRDTDVGRFDLPRAQELAQTFAQQFPAQVVEARHTSDLAEVLGKANGLIHATPMGMAAHPGMAFSPDLLRPDLWVAEIVYRPLETELLRQARLIGAPPTLSGGGMTVFQAVDAFRIFTGIEPDSKRMLAHMTELVHGEQTAAAL